MSLRWRILLLVLAASLLPVLATMGLLFQQRRTTLSEAREQMGHRTAAIAQSLDGKIAGTAQLLFGLARVPLVGGADRAACSNFLADVLKEHPQYTGILTIRPDGQLHCDSLRSGRSLQLADRSYFKRALTSTRPVVEAVFGRLTGKGVLQIAYPVRAADGRLDYVLLASFSLDEFGRREMQSPLFANLRLQVWNAEGMVVMQQPPGVADPKAGGLGQVPGELVASQDRVQTLGSGDAARIWATAALPQTADTGLRLSLSLPEADLRADVDRHFTATLWSLLTLSLLCFIAAAALAEFAVRRQASRLMSAISRLDRGDFSTPIGLPYPVGELGEVMSALDRTAESLEAQRSEITRSNAALERQAYIDTLTGLSNRLRLSDRLQQAMIYARRAGRVVSVLMLDLDRFKTINDSLGHSLGDELLRTIAQRLQECVRDGDTVARLGGDEFVVVLADMADLADTTPLAQKILAALAEPIRLGGQQVTSSASLGISVYPRDGDSVDALLRNADIAMYRAKEQGGGMLVYFAAEMNEQAQARLQLEAGLRRALAHGEFQLHYQPIVDGRSGRICGAEALLRWQDPHKGLVMPGLFIPVAEETGLIVPIGEWVLREACRQVRAWQDDGLPVIPVAVNLSARQFAAPTLVESVESALRDARCPATSLQLEITESMVMHQPERAMAVMHSLNDMGVQLSIDDFGTGYSSLSYLKRFPVRKLKIDRAFVRDIHIDPNDAAIVDAIQVLAGKLGLRTVAEGVETEAQLAFLRDIGCNEMQGYLFSRPCPPQALAAMLRHGLPARTEVAMA